ncbi:MAG: pantoate--beta-alanine ligase, partial [Sandaracinaceae bacterium]|nr:pantoate--beta-alanine ligase [Sandaracinaceae bacterium]
GRLRALALAEVERTFDSVDYVAIADPDTLAPIEGAMGPRAVLAVAARVAGTRLIDNVVLGEDPEP